MDSLSQEEIPLDDYKLNDDVKMSLYLSEDPFNNEKEKKHYKRLRRCLTLQNNLNASKYNFYFNKLKEDHAYLFNQQIIKKLYVHFDLDMFYAQVEMLRSGNNFPLGIGSNLMLCTCNYLAREHGVRAGMPGYLAKKLCPNLVIINPDFKRINFYSDEIMKILSLFDNEIEIYGIDEACLILSKEKLKEAEDIIKEKNLQNEVEMRECNSQEVDEINNNFIKRVDGLIQSIRAYVYKKTCLTISAGISYTRGLAKYASGVNKPNGQYFTTDYDLELPIDKINGIGNATKEILNKTLKIKNICELREKMNEIFLKLTEKTAISLLHLSYGVGYFDFRSNKKVHSKGISTSFQGTLDLGFIYDKLFFLCDSLFKKIKGYIGTTLTLKLRYSSFKTVNKSMKIGKIERVEDLFNSALSLLKEKEKIAFPEKVNQIGISISDLKKLEPLQLCCSNAAERECPICYWKFYHESDTIVQSHVELCIKKKAAKEKMTLDKYLIKKEK
ncbi:hypothetical protein H312_01687 [Anncaliia algerae PRA339]|uniref:DNA polymerase kappa n=1 Tax=Anncaliia algerae PRA339 TaxID=1288291 RepID=A0A059F1M7_9MICR|nr:hypothetical protein H312_01687 [Anncaliia algerae PRA339]